MPKPAHLAELSPFIPSSEIDVDGSGYQRMFACSIRNRHESGLVSPRSAGWPRAQQITFDQPDHCRSDAGADHGGRRHGRSSSRRRYTNTGLSKFRSQ